jgi:hypothetical protein
MHRPTFKECQRCAALLAAIHLQPIGGAEPGPEPEPEAAAAAAAAAAGAAGAAPAAPAVPAVQLEEAADAVGAGEDNVDDAAEEEEEEDEDEDEADEDDDGGEEPAVSALYSATKRGDAAAVAALLAEGGGGRHELDAAVPDGEGRDKSDCHFRKTVTEYDSKTGIKWLSCTAKWQSDITLARRGRPLPDAAAPRGHRQQPPGVSW